MNAGLIKLLRDVRDSYWFIPALMVFSSIFLAIAMQAVDRHWGHKWIRDLGLVSVAHGAGARSVLSTVAASMISVAGVTFSMTLVSVSFAAAQYGPRLIGNFMRDRGNQITLGTFVSTFVYALLVLRNTHDGTGDASEVPHVSVLVALALAMLSIGVLVYFIHHVPETINVSRITARIGCELASSVESSFSDDLGESGPVGARIAHEPLTSTSVTGETSGYLQAVSEEPLFCLTREHDLVAELLAQPGDFVVAGQELLRVGPRERVTKEVIEAFQSCFATGLERTKDQDMLFLVNQLVEILGRALSPGVNDPFTAVACLHWMQCSLVLAANRSFPTANRFDEEGRLRVVVDPMTFEDFVEAALGESIPYVAPNRDVCFTFLEVVGQVAGSARTNERRALLLGQADLLVACAEEIQPHESDREALRARRDEIQRRTPSC